MRLAAGLLTFAATMIWIAAAHAQTAPNARPAPPAERATLRFVTTDDFPPFNARDDEGSLVGFNVDLARAICLELEMTCQIEAQPWEQLFPILDQGRADALIAAHRINVETIAKADFTRPYFHTPGRFAIRRDGPELTFSPAGLDRRAVGVAKGTTHEAYIQTFFRTSRIKRFDTPEAARTALRAGEVETIFGDGIGLVFWINGSLSGGCCELTGEAYLEPLFFGDGIGIAVRKGNQSLKAGLDRAIVALRGNGRMLELMRRYFPRKVY